MAFNNQNQMPGVFPGAERDGFGYTQDNNVRMTDDLATTMVDGHDRVLSTPQVGRKDRQPSASYDVLASERRHRGSVQQDSRTHRPGVRGHSGGNLSSKGGSRFHPYNRRQQTVPPNAFGDPGDTYPTPPIAWHNGPNTTSQNTYQDPRPSAFGNHGGASSRVLSAQNNVSNFSSRRSQQDVNEPQTLTSSWNQGQFSRPAMPTPQPLQKSPQYGTSGWHRDPVESAIAQRFAPVSNAPSPYAANVPYVNSHSWPRIDTRSDGKILHAEARHRGSRHPAVPAVDDEVEDGEDSPGEEVGGEAGEKQELPRAKGTKTSRKASKAKENVRRGLICSNANGELEWLASVDSEGVLAVRHDDIRPQLIAVAEAERVALGVQNEHPDEPGPGKYNVTSFYREHVKWGPNREDRPEIDFDWEEDREKNPRPKCPGYMYWEDNGKKYVVLDPHDNPVKDWDMPATIASNIPGYKLEAMRRENMSLGHKDFWARMQSHINVGTEDQPVWEELGHPNSIVNMPMERFRFHAGLCSWTERKKTLIIKAGLKKLYGNILQNNSVRAFGRDLTTREIKEIKKGDNAVFPIEGDVVLATRKAVKKDRSKGAVKPTKPKGNAKVEKAQFRKRKLTTDDEGQSSEEESLTQVRSHKRARHRSKEDSIAAEVDDLVMFDQYPTIIDQADATRRYSLRTTREDAKAPKQVETIKELSGESSADEKYEDIPAQRYPPRKPRKAAAARGNNKRVEKSSRGSLIETDGEEAPAPRFPFRRIPRAGEVDGKSKRPSWVSLAEVHSQSNEEKDYRHTAVPVSIGGSVHYATYEGLISYEPAYCIRGSGTLSQGQAPEAIGASLEQNESCPPQPHAFETMMNTPLLEPSNLEGKDTPLQAHRKWVKEFLEDEGALKRLRTVQPVLPLPGSAIRGGTSKTVITPQTVPPQVNQSSRAPPTPHAPFSQTGEQKLDGEWAQVFDQIFVDLGFRSVNYSEVPPWNEEEVQSLIDALLPTREVYFAWTGEPAPRTDPQQSYRAQFDTIFEAFQDWWRAHRPDKPLPILTGVMHWGRSVDDWEPPSKDSIYYEAFRKGHRAPRGVNRQILNLSDWPGSRLEDALRKMYQGDDWL